MSIQGTRGLGACGWFVHFSLLCLTGLTAAGCYRSHSIAAEGASSDAGAAPRCETRRVSLGGAYSRVVGPVLERSTSFGDPVPLAWSGDGRRLVVGGSGWFPRLEEYPPVVVLDATRPCFPPIALLAASNPRTVWFAQAVWASADGATVTVCSELDVGPRWPVLGEVGLQVFRESTHGFAEGGEAILRGESTESRWTRLYWCSGLEVSSATVFVHASDGVVAYEQRDSRLVELARAPEAPEIMVWAIVASSNGTRVAIAAAPMSTDDWVEPVSVRLYAFSQESGFAPIASFAPDTDGWPPRGFHAELAMPEAGEAVVARSEPSSGPTSVAVLRALPTGGYEVSPVPAASAGLMPVPWRRSVWVSPDGTRVAWISGNDAERDELTLTIADITDTGIEERWSGVPAGVEGPAGCSTPWSAVSAAFAPDGRLAVAVWCASASCPIGRGRPFHLGCEGPLQVFVYE